MPALQMQRMKTSFRAKLELFEKTLVVLFEKHQDQTYKE